MSKVYNVRLIACQDILVRVNDDDDREVAIDAAQQITSLSLSNIHETIVETVVSPEDEMSDEEWDSWSRSADEAVDWTE